MAILEKEIWVGVHHSNQGYFEKLGYVIPKYIDKQKRVKIKKGTKVLIRTTHLTEGSNVKVTKICDFCGKSIPNQKYCDVIGKRINGDGHDRCFDCGISFGRNNRKNNVTYEKSIEYWAINNKKEYLINEWSIKNNKKLSEVSYASHDFYWWECDKCNSKYEMPVNNKTTGEQGCPYCAGKKVNKTNCLWTTHPDIAKLLTDKEIGYKITSNHTKKISFTCPDCGNIELKSIITATTHKYSCSVCSDGISYPEKFMISLLKQLNVKFERGKIFNWSRKLSFEDSRFNGRKLYDFYLPKFNLIIETHGKQHYIESFKNASLRTLEYEKLNDKIKEDLARNNGVQFYVVVDCFKSDIEYLKNSILNSDLINFFNLDNIDWIYCHEFACHSLMKVVCDMWNSGLQSTEKIAKELNMGRAAIRNYLKQGTLLGICNYDPDKVRERVYKKFKKGVSKTRPIVQLSKDGKLIKHFNSISEASRETNAKNSSIQRVCSGVKKTTYGFRWMYLEDYEKQFNKELIIK